MEIKLFHFGYKIMEKSYIDKKTDLFKYKNIFQKHLVLRLKYRFVSLLHISPDLNYSNL